MFAHKVNTFPKGKEMINITICQEQAFLIFIYLGPYKKLTMKTTLTVLIVSSLLLMAGACRKKEPEEPKPYATFSLKGAKVQYNDYLRFNRFCIMSHYCGEFMARKDDMEKNSISIGLPDHVESGQSHQTGEHHFYFIWVSPEGKYYSSHSGGHLSVSISLWEGNGGWVKGTFSGSLPNEEDPVNDSIVLDDGYFQGKIYYITH